MRRSAFEKAELEEEQNRLNQEGMSLQQQNKNYNMKRNASFIRRLNEDFFNS